MQKKYTIFIAVTILFASLLGHFLIPILSHEPESDSINYDLAGQGLANNGEYVVTGGYIRAPGYPFFLAMIYKLFGVNYYNVYAAQFLLLSLIAILAFFISKKFLELSFKKSLLSSVLILTWPYFLLYSSYLLSEILYTLFLVTFFFNLLLFIKKGANKNFVISTIFLALATLTRPILLLLPFWLVIFMLLYSLIFKTKFQKKQLYTISLFVPLLYLLISPWVIFASNKMGQFVPITNTASGVAKKANSSYDYEYRYVAYKNENFAAGNEITLSMKIKSKLKNIYRFWKSGAEGYQADALVKKHPAFKYLILAYRFYHYAIVALALLSILFIKKNRYLAFFWIIISYTWGVHTMLFPAPRFTLPIIPLVLILANFSFWEIIHNSLLPFRSERQRVKESLRR